MIGHVIINNQFPELVPPARPMPMKLGDSHMTLHEERVRNSGNRHRSHWSKSSATVHVRTCTCGFMEKHEEIFTFIWLNRIGRAEASSPSRADGAPLYVYIYIIYVIRQCHLLVPVGPHAVRKRKAGSITSRYLVKLGVSWMSRCVTGKPWLVHCDSRFGLPLSSYTVNA